MKLLNSCCRFVPGSTKVVWTASSVGLKISTGGIGKTVVDRADREQEEPQDRADEHSQHEGDQQVGDVLAASLFERRHGYSQFLNANGDVAHDDDVDDDAR